MEAGGSSETEITWKTAVAVATSSRGVERESTTAVSDGGVSSPSAADVGNEEEGASPVTDGCVPGATGSTAPEMDPRNGASKPEKLTLHGDAAVAPVASTSFKRSGGGSTRRTVQKRVVTVPIAEVGEGSRPRSSGASAGDAVPPPSDPWTWRKYGQKPIKGSPYPRGYYRCSSSKGCPARKQVERSRADPTMLIVTYAAEHNHPWPMPRNSSHHASRQSAAAQAALGGGAGPPAPAPAGKPPPPSSSSTDEDYMEVEYENAAVGEEEDQEVEVKEKILAEPEFTVGMIATTTTTVSTTTATATASNAPATTSSPTSEETETVSADHSDDSTTIMAPVALEGVDELCSNWFTSETEISLCSTADTPALMLPFSYDELLADLGGRSGGGGYGVDEDEESLFAGLGELPEFSLVSRRGLLPEHAADFTRRW